jgi:hypothetical protein
MKRRSPLSTSAPDHPTDAQSHPLRGLTAAASIRSAASLRVLSNDASAGAKLLADAVDEMERRGSHQAAALRLRLEEG